MGGVRSACREKEKVYLTALRLLHITSSVSISPRNFLHVSRTKENRKRAVIARYTAVDLKKDASVFLKNKGVFIKNKSLM